MATEINYDDLSANIKDYVIVDVRNKDEVLKHGQIEGSHNIPFSELSEAFAKSPEDFNASYGFQKPLTSTAIVTHCMKGGRAQKAAIALQTNMGYSNIKLFKGSFNDWVANGGKVIKLGTN